MFNNNNTKRCSKAADTIKDFIEINWIINIRGDSCIKS